MIRDLVREGVRRLIGCRHTTTIRARRRVGDRDVLCFVCVDCGRAAPMIARTAEEQRVAFDRGRE